VGNPPEVTSDENSYAEIDDSRTIPDVPFNKGYLTKITAERARRERPDFIAPGTTPKSLVSAKLPFMTRLPKKRGITQDGEDKSLILRRLDLYANELGLQELMNSIKATFAAQA
jgi:hypothetical protein